MVSNKTSKDSASKLKITVGHVVFHTLGRDRYGSFTEPKAA